NLGSLNFGNGPRAEGWEDIAPERPPFSRNATQLLDIKIGQVLLLDNPPQSVGAGNSRLARGGERIAAFGNLTEDRVRLALCQGEGAAVDGHAARSALGRAILDDEAPRAGGRHHQTKSRQRWLPEKFPVLARAHSRGSYEFLGEIGSGHVSSRHSGKQPGKQF